MKIFQILEKQTFDTGSVQQMFQAAAGLAGRGHEVTVISRPGEELAARCREASVDYRHLPFRNELDVHSLRALARFVREKNPDVIHVHKGLSHTLALAATLRHPVAAFVVNRGVSFPLTFWNRAKYRTSRVDRVVTVCRQIKDIIVDSGKVPSSRVEVIYAGTDTRRFDPSSVDSGCFRQEKQIPPEAFLFLQVGIRDWKGWRELIDAFADVVEGQQRDIRLALVACKTEAQKRQVEAYAAGRGVAGRLHLVEYRTDMPEVLAAADVVADASWGGTGITGTIREAMAMKRAVVATDCGGNRELVSSPSVGWLVPPKDRAALAAAMRETLASDSRRETIAAAARRLVEAEFSMEHRIDRLEHLYGSIVTGKRDGPKRPASLW